MDKAHDAASDGHGGHVDGGVAQARSDLEASAAMATTVIEDLRRQLQRAKDQVNDLDKVNGELMGRLANASGSDAEAFAAAAEQKRLLTNARGEIFELKAQNAEMSEELRRARLEAMDARKVAKEGEKHSSAAEEVARLRTQIEEMEAQQREWDDAWKKGKEALLRVHAQELQNQRDAAMEEAELKVEAELTDLRNKCGELTRDKLLLEEKVSKLLRTKEHLDIANAALSEARAELRNREGEASMREMRLKELEAELVGERERREKQEKKAMDREAEADERLAAAVAAEAAAREEAIALGARERTKLEGLVKSLRQEVKVAGNTGDELRHLRQGRLGTHDSSTRLQTRVRLTSESQTSTKSSRNPRASSVRSPCVREAYDVLKQREKEASDECDRLRRELDALRARTGDDGPQPDHVTFGAYVQKCREGKHQEAKTMAKRAALSHNWYGVGENNKAGVGGGGGLTRALTGVRPKSPSAAPVPYRNKGGGGVMSGVAGRTGRGAGSTQANGGTGGEGGGGTLAVDALGGRGAAVVVKHGRRRGGT